MNPIKKWVPCKGSGVQQTLFKVYVSVVCGHCKRQFTRRGRETIRVNNMQN